MSEPEGRSVAWTEEQSTSDEGRRRLKGAPEASGEQSTSDEGRRRLKGAPEASGRHSMGDEVRYEIDNSVAWLTINRPAARNALSAAVREGLAGGFRRFTEDEGARVLVLTG